MTNAPRSEQTWSALDDDGGRTPEQRAAMLDMIMAYRLTQAVHTAVALGLPDLLASGPMALDELAERSGAHPAPLFRFLRALASTGVVRCESGRFALTPLGAWLRTDRPGSVAPIARFYGHERVWTGWGRLVESVVTGQPSEGPRSEHSFLDRHARDPEGGAIFDAAMSAMTAGHIPAILAAYDFSSFSRIVDVAGGQGALLAAILAASLGPRGVLFDLPPVVAGAHPTFERAGVAERSELVGGDVFESIPPGGDCYVLKAVIHDWDDARGLIILRNCRRAVDPGGRIVLVERVVPEAIDTSERLVDMAFSDLNMLVMVGGRERTEEEFRSLLGAAGLRLARVVPTALAHSILEAMPER
jgi:SAM-dependent methyltransferase